MASDPAAMFAALQRLTEQFNVPKQLDQLEVWAAWLMRSHGAIERAYDAAGGTWWKIPDDAPPAATRARQLYFEILALRDQAAGVPAGALHHAIKVGAIAAVLAIDVRQGEGLTVTRAADIAGVTKPTICKAADAGEILDNGKRRRARRLEPLSFVLWLLARTPEAPETDAQVEAKLRRAAP
jgi:hypothetical protein